MLEGIRSNNNGNGSERESVLTSSDLKEAHGSDWNTDLVHSSHFALLAVLSPWLLHHRNVLLWQLTVRSLPQRFSLPVRCGCVCLHASHTTPSPLPNATMTSTPPSFSRLPDAPSQSDRDALLIFVSIVSYRDPETLPTLRSLLTTASHPSRLRIGLVWQYDTAADTRLFLPPPAPTSPFFPDDAAAAAAMASGAEVRQLLLSSAEARGPMYARSLCETLYRNEQFYLQIDSHMRFTPDWDTQLINTIYHAAGSTTLDARIILTGYPADYQPHTQPDNDDDQLADQPINIMTATHFGGDGMLRLKGVPLSSSFSPPPPHHSHLTTHPPTAPLPPLIPAYFLAAGFLFSSYALPTLVSTPLTFPGLFFGEEILLSVRCFTSGFRMYHCLRPVARHCWSRSYRPSWRVDRAAGGEMEVKEMEREAERSRAKVTQLLTGGRGDRGSDVEGLLGCERSVEGYWEWVGVDWQNKVVSERAQRGGLDEALLDRRKGGSGASAGVDAKSGLNNDLLQRIMAFAQVNT